MLRRLEKFTLFEEGFCPPVDERAGQVHAARGFFLFGSLHAWEQIKFSQGGSET
jgi:hypothetical protein